jgi:hypothetical protein
VKPLERWVAEQQALETEAARIRAEGDSEAWKRYARALEAREGARIREQRERSHKGVAAARRSNRKADDATLSWVHVRYRTLIGQGETRNNACKRIQEELQRKGVTVRPRTVLRWTKDHPG